MTLDEEKLATLVKGIAEYAEKLGDRYSPSEVAEKLLGYAGRMMSGSKSGYNKSYPRNIAVFNSNLFMVESAPKSAKLWHGDIDVTLDSPKLVELAKLLSQDVYLLYEMDGRFQNSDKPVLDRPVMIYRKDGTIEVGPAIAEYVEVAKRGRLAGRYVYKKEFAR